MKQTLNQFTGTIKNVKNTLNQYAEPINSNASYTKYLGMEATFNNMDKFEGTGKIRTITPKAELEKHVRNNMKEMPLNVKRLVLGGVIAAGVISNIMDGGQQTNAKLFGQQPY